MKTPVPNHGSFETTLWWFQTSLSCTRRLGADWYSSTCCSMLLWTMQENFEYWVAYSFNLDSSDWLRRKYKSFDATFLWVWYHKTKLNNLYYFLSQFSFCYWHIFCFPETFNKLRSVLLNTTCADFVSFILGFLSYDISEYFNTQYTLYIYFNILIIYFREWSDQVRIAIFATHESSNAIQFRVKFAIVATWQVPWSLPEKLNLFSQIVWRLCLWHNFWVSSFFNLFTQLCPLNICLSKLADY